MTRQGSSLRILPILALLAVSPFAVPQNAPANGTAGFDPACSDPRAIAVADLALRAVGGPESLQRVHYLRFSFVLLRGREVLTHRTHLWDRSGQRLRYESLDDTGAGLVVILGLVDGKGQVYRAGHPVEEPQASQLRARAYEAWRNDAYWLLMPYRLKDPGICMDFAGEVVEDNGHYDRLYLTIAGDGPALPGERYRADFDRTTHLLTFWSRMEPGGGTPTSTTVWRWGDWRRRDGLLFAQSKESRSAGEPVRIVHPVLELPGTVSEVDFLNPMPLAPAPAAR